MADDNISSVYNDCDYCHGTNAITGTHGTPEIDGDVHNDGDVDFADVQTLGATTVCNNCHSKDGLEDGVNNATYGAKALWTLGHGTTAKWCAGCHDNVPSSISAYDAVSSTVVAVTAINVLGDGSTYGYYKTGHGLINTSNYPSTGSAGADKDCLVCHDDSWEHIDGIEYSYDPDTYDAVSKTSNYQEAYRLKDINGNPPLHIPRDKDADLSVQDYAPDDFALCFKSGCHNGATLLRAANTNDIAYEYLGLDTYSSTLIHSVVGSWGSYFRNSYKVKVGDGGYSEYSIYGTGDPGIELAVPWDNLTVDEELDGSGQANAHFDHLHFKVDFTVTDGRKGWKSKPSATISDSRMSCPSCHFVHGTDSPGPMIRDDLNFYYLKEHSAGLPQVACTDIKDSSVGGIMIVNGSFYDEDTNPTGNKVCEMCHGASGEWAPSGLGGYSLTSVAATGYNDYSRPNNKDGNPPAWP